MACTALPHSPLHHWHSIFRALPTTTPSPIRALSTASITPPQPRIPPRRLLPNIDSDLFKPPKTIKTYPPPPSTRLAHPHPIQSLQQTHISETLDPTGSRTRLFEKRNPDCPRQGDILLVTFTSGDPFSGVCLSIRRRGVTDTAILLRNRVMMVGVEMWVKIYSPKVKSIEVVERAQKRAKRARLYYMRKAKHDRGSVEGVVEEYLKRMRLVRSGAVGMREPGRGGKVGGGGSGRERGGGR
ncbi:MAG: hypothetical protein LQ338_005660 [Usnochroma carphineum]|nr:MAG: hypothetical protein LQ338_005660 [Usnochroma carphineum]